MHERSLPGLTHQKTVETLLSGLYGKKKLQGPPLTGQRHQAHISGRPTVSSYQGIVDELKAAGPLSRGLVFIEQAPSAENPLGAGHVVNTRPVGNIKSFSTTPPIRTWIRPRLSGVRRESVSIAQINTLIGKLTGSRSNKTTERSGQV
jgi:hypothetical protein